ncbi:MAG: DUF1289 domain-containing protein [Rhodospirillales bacterium]|nr:DUF1289 domain-containing protein [Rhodospirillales bacterium]
MSESQASPEDRQRRRERRRERLHAGRLDTTIPSPCISVCQIDDATDCCIGCHRSIDEIRDWPIMSAEQKTEALGRVAARKAAARPGP